MTVASEHAQTHSPTLSPGSTMPSTSSTTPDACHFSTHHLCESTDSARLLHQKTIQGPAPPMSSSIPGPSSHVGGSVYGGACPTSPLPSQRRPIGLLIPELSQHEAESLEKPKGDEYTLQVSKSRLIRPFELPMSSGKHVWIQPSKANALLSICGAVGVNTGVCARAALEHPEKSWGSTCMRVRTG